MARPNRVTGERGPRDHWRRTDLFNQGEVSGRIDDEASEIYWFTTVRDVLRHDTIYARHRRRVRKAVLSSAREVLRLASEKELSAGCDPFEDVALVVVELDDGELDRRAGGQRFVEGDIACSCRSLVSG